jgi:tetratricopeptide (TPR) repeat protein
VLQIIPFGIWVADRYLYIPMVGLLVLASVFFFDLLDRLGRAAARAATAASWAFRAAMCAVLVAFAWLTAVRLPVWKDDLTLWEATYPTCSNSAYCNENLGLALLKAGQPQRGGDLLVRAVELRPAPLYLVNLADALTLSAKNYPEAIRFYRAAIDGAQASNRVVSDAYAGLARAYVMQGDLDEAAKAIETGKNLGADNPRLWVAEGFLHWKRGDIAEARRVLGISLMITGQRSRYFDFFVQYWGDTKDVASLLADARAHREATAIDSPSNASDLR